MQPEIPEFAQIATWLGIVNQLYATRMNQLLGKHNFTTGQFALLNHLARHPNDKHPVSSFAAAIDINQSGATKIVQKLTKMGLVEVMRDSTDSRRRLVSIKPEGYQTIHRVQQDLAPDVQAWFADWDSAEQDAFLNNLMKLGGWLDANRL